MSKKDKVITRTITVIRDSNGKFASKKPPVEKPENPDCENATKSYVKCLLREQASHNHYFRNDAGRFTFIFICIGCMAWIALMFMGSQPFPAWSVGIVTTYAIMNMLDYLCLADFNETELSSERDSLSIQRHRYREKRECEK